MTGRNYVVLISTFLMGMFAGAYLYVTAFAPTYENGIDASENIDQDALVIEGEMYGGCSLQGACASFRLIDAKSYKYLAHSEAALRSGRLPSLVREQLLDALTPTALMSSSQNVSSGVCSSEVDGIDYRYTISVNGDVYELDTCSTALTFDEELQSIFMNVWFVLENPDSVPKEDFDIELGFDKLFWDRFHNGAE
jgi:hypothetical protein